MLSVRTSANGHGRGERSGPRTWDTSPQAIDAPHLASPRSTHNYQQLLKKQKNGLFFAVFGRQRLAEAARNGPGRGSGAAHVRGSAER